MTAWDEVKKYFNNRCYRAHVRRADYLRDLPNISVKLKDTYRCLLMNAGYLSSARPGVYVVRGRIPEGITVADVAKQKLKEVVNETCN